MRTRWSATVFLLLTTVAAFAQETPPPPKQLTPIDIGARQLAAEYTRIAVRLNEFVRQHPDDLQRRKDDFARIKLGLEKARLLLLRYTATEVRNSLARQLMDESRERMELLLAGKPFPPDPPGIVEKAYLSELDDSAQPYYLYRPPGLNTKKPVPLILYLHGYVGYLDKVNWFEMTFPGEYITLADRTNGIVLAPFARSNTDFQGIGEKDVVDTIRKVLAETPADPDRVFLGGVSMGGSGVWTVAAHNPDLFAGIFPIAGRTDYYLWRNLKRAELPRHKSYLIDKEFSITFPQNFINLPVRCYHATNDVLVKVEHSRVMQRALKSVGAHIRYDELPEGNHWGSSQNFGDKRLVRWIKSTKRNRFPKTVRFKVLELHNPRAYWVSINRIDKWGTPAEVTAKRVSRKLIRLSSSNVGALTLHLDRKQLKLADRVTIELDGKEHVAELDENEDVHFKLTLADALHKRPGLCGPFSDVLNSRFILVCPTQGDAQAVMADQTLAGKFLRDWQTFSTGLARLKRDTDITDDDIAGANLILLGSPGTNALLARIADKLPIRFADGEYVVGKQRYPDTLGLVMVYPNPLNPKRMIAVCSGLHYGEHLPVNHKYDLIPDYIIFEEQADDDGTNWFRCAGLFDSNWQLDEVLMETRGPAPPPVPEPQRIPEFEVQPEPLEPDFEKPLN